MLTERAVIGIDPGGTGAAVLISETKNHISVLRFDKGGLSRLRFWLIDALVQFNIISVGFEQVFGRRGDKPNRVFVFGMNTGKAIARMEDLSIPYIEIPSTTWKRAHNLPPREDYEQRKKDAHKKAKEIFGNSVTRDEADAYLIANYMHYRTFGGQKLYEDRPIIPGTGRITKRVTRGGK